ncbi:MAG: aminopeptidase, partial [Odoribacter sp.]|nr:aminopeptidase [Odoribacter sp.]
MKKLTFLTLVSFLALTSVSNAQEQKKENEGYQFTDIKRLPTTSVKSQDRAGTCWSWSTISFLESEMMRMGKDSVSLSPMYIVWNTYHGKADKYVRLNGHMNFAQGGA